MFQMIMKDVRMKWKGTQIRYEYPLEYLCNILVADRASIKCMFTYYYISVVTEKLI